MSQSQFYKDSIFWIDVNKIKPNPFQPRREFDPAQLQSLADSIRQYGVLQALVVTRNEVQKEDGLVVEYELIAGERRLRASKMAGLSVVPVLIKDGQESDQMKLELAIIENLQREDLNVVDRAIAFKKLTEEFKFTQDMVAKKVGKSRVYVSNTMRVLNLPAHMLQALKDGKITEGHTRPLLMLEDRKEEQEVLFKDITIRRMSVREAELVARNTAVERAKNRSELMDMETRELQDKLTQTFGTRVTIEQKHEAEGGKVTIAFFSKEDLRNILAIMEKQKIASDAIVVETLPVVDEVVVPTEEVLPIDDRSKEEVTAAEETESDDELYSMKNFSI
jgi:ParB family chromosome partitioning protein